MTQLVSHPFQACNDIFFKPNRVFATIKEKDNWSWLPFFLVVIMAVLPSYFYFNFVDFDWYKELVIQSTMADVSPSEQNTVRNTMTPGQTKSFALFGTFLVYILINAVLAIYLNITCKMDPENLHGFTDWYGFTWWVSMPGIIGSTIAIFIILLADNHQLSPVDLSPTSLAFLLGLGMDSPWFNLTQGIRLEAFWSIYLIAVGVSQWTRIPARKSFIIALAPYLLIWGIWALILIAS